VKSKPTLLAVEIVLARVLAGSNQSVVQFASNSSFVPDWASSTAVPDYASPIRLAVQRTNDLNTVVSVDYATADGTATNGWQYAATNGTLVFAPGETNKTIVVQLLAPTKAWWRGPRRFG